MVYNSNTSTQQYQNKNYTQTSNYGERANRSLTPFNQPITKSNPTGGYVYWGGAKNSNDFDVYGQWLLKQSARGAIGSVTYGPGEDPVLKERGYGSAGGFQEVMQNKYQNQTGIVMVTDPLGRSTGSYKGPIGNEVSLMQLQQTMGELKNRAAIESTAAYNRTQPPAARINRLTQPEVIMEKLLPGIMNDARTTIIKSTMLTGPMLGRPYIDSSAKNQYFNMQTGSWEYGKRAPDYSKMPGPELIENVIEENTLWKSNVYHGADYEEGPSTKDKTKETIKTIKETGAMVTTDIGDNAFKKNKEFEKSETESGKKEAALKQEMQETKKSGLLGLVE